MFHLTVWTTSGARYLIRMATMASGNVYVSSTDSSSGLDLTNCIVDPSSVQIGIGERMEFRNAYGTPIVLTSRVTAWQLDRVDRVMTPVMHRFGDAPQRVVAESHDVYVVS